MNESLMTEVYAGVYLGGAPPQPQYRSLENPNLPLNDPAIWEAVFGDSYGTEAGINVTAEKAMMYAPFYRAVSLISGDVAKLPRRVYERQPEKGEDARQQDKGHRLNYILNVAVNEYIEAVKFWARFMSDALIWNHAYARIYFDGRGETAELYNLLPDRTSVEWTKDGQMFYVTEAGGNLVPLMPWEVLHIEGPPVNGKALALFRLARNSIALGLAQENFQSKFFKNGARIGGVLELPIGMPKGARDTLEEGFRKAYEGTDNPFKTVILRDNAKFHAGQMSPEQSQMVEATEAQTRAIAHWFNLPPSKLGLSDSVSYNSKAEDNQNYLDTTLQIWLTKIESACNFRLISENQARTHFIEHNVSKLLRMNRLQMAQVHASDIAARVRNPNECRAELNMLPYPEGEEFVNPNTMKSGNEPGEKPKEDKPEPKKRDAAYMRVLFGITASARHKADNPNAFIAWVDGNLAKHRAEWKHLWGDQPFPFDDLRQQLHDLAGRCHAPDLPAEVETLCKAWEE
jgi:HK97 family phage portal protein